MTKQPQQQPTVFQQNAAEWKAMHLLRIPYGDDTPLTKAQEKSIRAKAETILRSPAQLAEAERRYRDSLKPSGKEKEAAPDDESDEIDLIEDEEPRKGKPKRRQPRTR